MRWCFLLGLGLLLSGCASVQFYGNASDEHLNDYRNADKLELEVKNQYSGKFDRPRACKEVELKEAWRKRAEICLGRRLTVWFWPDKAARELPIESPLNTICDIRLTKDNVLYYVECDTFLWNDYRIIHVYDLERHYIGEIKVNMKKVPNDFFEPGRVQ